MKLTISALVLSLTSTGLVSGAFLKRQSLPTTPVSPPGAVQEGVTDQCNRWDFVETGSTCELFLNRYPGLTLADLQEWNPVIKKEWSECALWAQYWICTSVVGAPPTNTTSPTPSTTTTITPHDPGETDYPEEGTIVQQRPTFVQAGQPVDCESWYIVKSGEKCINLTWKLGITYATFFEYNPALGQNCEQLWRSYGYCIGTIRNPYVPVPTPTSDPVVDGTPVPTQEGMVKGCKEFLKVETDDTCEAIVEKTGVESEEKLMEWNPVLVPSCTSKLWAGYYICIGV